MNSSAASSTSPFESDMVFDDTADLHDHHWDHSPLLDSPLKPRMHEHTRVPSADGGMVLSGDMAMTGVAAASAAAHQHHHYQHHHHHPSRSNIQQNQHNNFPNPQPQIQHHHNHHNHHHQYSGVSSQGMSIAHAAQRPQSGARRRMIKEKMPKGDREEVWPLDVENAFMKALEVLPKLGRRKVLVNGKPCGRNELIADFIYQQTQKVRDRKQVSSHIQVLKNTRKHEPAFMRLLMDSGEGDEDGMQETTNTGYMSTLSSPMPSPHLQQHDRTERTLFDERPQHHHHHPSHHHHHSFTDRPTTATPPSNSAFDFDTSPSLHASYTHHSSFRHQHSQPKHHQNHQHGHHRVKSGTPSDPMADHTMAHEATAARHNSIQSIYRQSATTPDSAVSLSSDSAHRDFTREGLSSHQRGAYTSPPRYRDLPRGPATLPHSVEFSPLWPTFFGLFIQHPKSEMLTDSDIQQDGFDPSDNHIADSHSLVHTHELARASDLDRHAFSTIDIHQLPQEKFPCLYDLYERATCAFLFFKVDMNLNLALDKGTFENTCLFRANERRTLRCSTVIYSFGAKVLESTEVKQASSAEMSGEDEGFMHSFEFVNQFFNAFLSGIRTLETSDEVEVALCNLSMVQVYEDMDPRAGEEGGGVAAPLLVMAFEFEEGRGGVAPYHIVDGSEMLETLVC